MKYLYRGISEGTRVCANGAMIEAPKEKGYYDLVELKHTFYQWKKSKYTKPEVLLFEKWYPFVDTHFN